MRLITCLNLLRWLQSEGDYGNGCNPSFIMTLSLCLSKNSVLAPQRTLASVLPTLEKYHPEGPVPHSFLKHSTLSQNSREAFSLRTTFGSSAREGRGGAYVFSSLEDPACSRGWRHKDPASLKGMSCSFSSFAECPESLISGALITLCLLLIS